MSAVNWRRVAELHALALERPVAARKQFLDGASVDEPPGVRERVDELLELSAAEEGPLFDELKQLFARAAEAVEEELTPKEGTCLLGRYVIRSKIGAGGMGVVYAAEDHKFDPPAKRAVKMIRLEILAAADAEALSAFQAEANIMARITHERFVRVYDVGKQQLFLVMELIEGGSLEERGQATWSPREAAGLVAALAAAMAQVHALGIVHLDLKPGNILFTPEKAPKIVDFGIAKLQGKVREPGRVMGSPANMAPEQWRGDSDQIDSPADVYALGTILYELLTGTPPYAPQSKSPEELKRLVTDPEVRPDRPDAKHWWDNHLGLICLKCLEKDPARRYTAAELALDLERWRLDQAPRRVLVSWRARARLWCRRNPTGLILLLAVTAFLGLAGWRIFDALREPARAQAALARQQAKTLELRLLQLSDALTKAARDHPFGELLEQKDSALKTHLIQTAKERVDLNGRSPFQENWFLVDLEGTIVARSSRLDARFEHAFLAQRDYFKGACELAEAKGGSPVYVSRVYQSIIPEDKRYKFGFATVVRHDGEVVGVLVATVTTGPDMGLLELKDGELVTALLAEEDPFVMAGEQRPRGSASPYLILLHPAYRQGDQPVWFPKARLDELRAGVTADYRDPLAVVNEEYAGRWLAAFAPVEGSSFIVVVQRPYRPLLPGGAWLALGLGIVACVLLAALLNRWPRKTPGSNHMAASRVGGTEATRSWHGQEASPDRSTTQ